MQKLKQEAEVFYMDRQRGEREHGVTISCTTRELFTKWRHYAITNVPGHRDLIKSMILVRRRRTCF